MSIRTIVESEFIMNIVDKEETSVYLKLGKNQYSMGFKGIQFIKY